MPGPFSNGARTFFRSSLLKPGVYKWSRFSSTSSQSSGRTVGPSSVFSTLLKQLPNIFYAGFAVTIILGSWTWLSVKGSKYMNDVPSDNTSAVRFVNGNAVADIPQTYVHRDKGEDEDEDEDEEEDEEEEE